MQQKAQPTAAKIREPLADPQDFVSEHNKAARHWWRAFDKASTISKPPDQRLVTREGGESAERSCAPRTP
jgi:hypothetical protein